MKCKTVITLLLTFALFLPTACLKANAVQEEGRLKIGAPRNDFEVRKVGALGQSAESRAYELAYVNYTPLTYSLAEKDEVENVLGEIVGSTSFIKLDSEHYKMKYEVAIIFSDSNERLEKSSDKVYSSFEWDFNISEIPNFSNRLTDKMRLSFIEKFSTEAVSSIKVNSFSPDGLENALEKILDLILAQEFDLAKVRADRATTHFDAVVAQHEAGK